MIKRFPIKVVAVTISFLVAFFFYAQSSDLQSVSIQITSNQVQWQTALASSDKHVVVVAELQKIQLLSSLPVGDYTDAAVLFNSNVSDLKRFLVASSSLSNANFVDVDIASSLLGMKSSEVKYYLSQPNSQSSVDTLTAALTGLPTPLNVQSTLVQGHGNATTPVPTALPTIDPSSLATLLQPSTSPTVSPQSEPSNTPNSSVQATYPSPSSKPLPSSTTKVTPATISPTASAKAPASSTKAAKSTPHVVQPRATATPEVVPTPVPPPPLSDHLICPIPGSPHTLVFGPTNFWAVPVVKINGVWVRFHTGVDLASPYGTPILAAESGTVLEANHYNWGYGNHVWMQGKYVEVYGHMADISVKPGQFVTQGQVIGHEGSSGNALGPHLHFGVDRNIAPGSDHDWVDPFSLMSC